MSKTSKGARYAHKAFFPRNIKAGTLKYQKKSQAAKSLQVFLYLTCILPVSLQTFQNLALVQDSNPRKAIQYHVNLQVNGPDGI